jgi:hypothetical protein
MEDRCRDEPHRAYQGGSHAANQTSYKVGFRRTVLQPVNDYPFRRRREAVTDKPSDRHDGCQCLPGTLSNGVKNR